MSDDSLTQAINQTRRAVPCWTRPPEQLSLDSSAVHLWRIPLTLPTAALQRLPQTLSDSELNRAMRFHFQADRNRFVMARGAVRTILSRYVSCAAASLQFEYGAQGKPFLRTETNDTDELRLLRFNLSHSDDLALLAVTRAREVGLDVERIRPDFAGQDVAENFFSASEIAALLTVPESARAQAFFNCWTRKEAYLKARAEGLTFPLDQFSVSLRPGEPAALLHVSHEPAEIQRWSFHHLEPAPDYIGALVVEGYSRQCEFFAFEI